MKQIKFNLFLGFSLVVILLGTSVYLVKAQNSWIGPTNPFPLDQPAPPLDTSSYPQKKPASITITSSTSGNILNPDRAIEIDGKNIIFYNPQGVGNGFIYWSTLDRKFYVVDGDSVTPKVLVGAGNIWQATTTGIYVSSTVRVGIGTDSPVANSNLDVAGKTKVTALSINTNPSASGVPPSRLDVVSGGSVVGVNVYQSMHSMGGFLGRSAGIQVQNVSGLAGSSDTNFGIYVLSNGLSPTRVGQNIAGYFRGSGNGRNTGGMFDAIPTIGSSTNIGVNIVGPLNPSSGSSTNYAIYSSSKAQSYFAGPLCLRSTNPNDCIPSWASILGVTGSGETNYLPLWISSSTIGSSTIYQNGIGSVSVKNPSGTSELVIKGSGAVGGAGDSQLIFADNANNDFWLMQKRNVAQAGESNALILSYTPDGNVWNQALTIQPNSDVKFDGKVGIGTAAPASKLAVAGNMAIGASYANQTAPTNGAIIEGNLGVGVNNVPLTYKLDVAGDIHLGGIYDAPSYGIVFGMEASDARYFVNSCNLTGETGGKIPCPADTTPVGDVEKGFPPTQCGDITKDYDDIARAYDDSNNPLPFHAYYVVNCRADQNTYTIRNDRGNLRFLNSKQNTNVLFHQDGNLETTGLLTVNANLNRATTTPEIKLTTNVTNGNKGVLTHKITGPYNVPAGSPSRTGALVVGAGGTNNDIFLSKSDCVDGICNVPNIYLMGSNIMLSLDGANYAPLMVQYNASGNGYYAVYAP